MSGRVDSHCPNLMKVGPALEKHQTSTEYQSDRTVGDMSAKGARAMVGEKRKPRVRARRTRRVALKIGAVEVGVVTVVTVVGDAATSRFTEESLAVETSAVARWQ